MSKRPFNLPDKAYQLWKSFGFEGVEHAFEHISVSKHTFSDPDHNEQYTIFHILHHVFTRSEGE